MTTKRSARFPASWRARSPAWMPPWAPGVLVAALVAWPLFRWLAIDATWTGAAASACFEDGVRKVGACWPAVTNNLPLLLGGRYPQDMLWRPLTVIALGIASLLAPAHAGRGRPVWLLAPLAVLPAQLVVQAGHAALSDVGLPPVPTELWGGFALTWLLSAATILAALVPGFALALARTSRWRVVSALATGFIELVRGVPLITLLFVGHFLFPPGVLRTPGMTKETVRKRKKATLHKTHHMNMTGQKSKEPTPMLPSTTPELLRLFSTA